MTRGKEPNNDTDNIQLVFKKELKKKVNSLCKVKNTSVSQVVRDYLEKWSDREIEKLSPEKKAKFDELMKD